jgi:hypothetical protein
MLEGWLLLLLLMPRVNVASPELRVDDTTQIAHTSTNTMVHYGRYLSSRAPFFLSGDEPLLLFILCASNEGYQSNILVGYISGPFPCQGSDVWRDLWR